LEIGDWSPDGYREEFGTWNCELSIPNSEFRIQNGEFRIEICAACGLRRSLMFVRS